LEIIPYLIESVLFSIPNKVRTKEYEFKIKDLDLSQKIIQTFKTNKIHPSIPLKIKFRADLGDDLD